MDTRAAAPEHIVCKGDIMIDAAIVGLGRWGQGLVESVQDKSDAIRFIRGVTRTPAKAESFCAAHGIALGDDYAAALRDRTVAAVVLATPHSQHADQIVAAARRKRHVFCEKPFTLARRTAERALEVCAKAGIAVGLGHNRRWMENAVTLKKMIDAGELGTLLHVEGNFSADLTPAAGQWRDSRAESPAGGMTSLGIHVVDMMINLCGPVAEVDARSQRRALPYDIDDTTCALLGFRNGMSGYIGTMAAGGRAWNVRVFGSKGWAELRGADRLILCGPDGVENTRQFSGDGSLKAELEAFAAACDGGPAFPITPDQIVNGVATLEAIIKSAERGGKVVKIAG
jgi:predicted dehydrogenase